MLFYSGPVTTFSFFFRPLQWRPVFLFFSCRPVSKLARPRWNRFNRNTIWNVAAPFSRLIQSEKTRKERRTQPNHKSKGWPSHTATAPRSSRISRSTWSSFPFFFLFEFPPPFWLPPLFCSLFQIYRQPKWLFLQDECRIDFLNVALRSIDQVVDWIICTRVTHKCRLLCKSCQSLIVLTVERQSQIGVEGREKTPVSTWDGFRRSLKYLSSPSVRGFCLCRLDCIATQRLDRVTSVYDRVWHWLAKK